MDFMTVGPLSPFSRSEFLGQKQYCVEYHDGDKALCKSMDSSFCRTSMCRKGKSITRLSIYPSNEVSNIVNLSSGHWLVALENGVISQANLALSSSCQIW